MTLLAQLSDPHLRLDDDGASAGALERAVATVNGLDPGPDAVLITGDLANTPVVGEYELLRELVGALAAPVYVLGGNHDDQALMHSQFPLEGATSGDYRYAVEIGDLRVVACDSTVPGKEIGAFGAERLAWMESILDQDVERPTLLAMHHPPVDIGIDALDVIRIPDADAAPLEASLAERPQVARLICGHVHRGAVCAFAETAVFTCPSNHMAAELEIGVGGTPEELDLVPEPPAFAVHALLGNGRVVSHVQPILPT